MLLWDRDRTRGCRSRLLLFIEDTLIQTALWNSLAHYPAHPFNVYNSVASGIFSYGTTTTVSFRISPSPPKTPYALQPSPPPPCPLPQPLAPTHLFVSTDLLILGISCKWNPTTRGAILCPASFTQLNLFPRFPCCCMYQYFPFYGWVILHCMDMPYFVHTSLFIDGQSVVSTFWHIRIMRLGRSL